MRTAKRPAGNCCCWAAAASTRALSACVRQADRESHQARHLVAEQAGNTHTSLQSQCWAVLVLLHHSLNGIVSLLRAKQTTLSPGTLQAAARM